MTEVSGDTGGLPSGLSGAIGALGDLAGTAADVYKTVTGQQQPKPATAPAALPVKGSLFGLDSRILIVGGGILAVVILLVLVLRKK